MLRPILLRGAWRALTALAGFFTLAGALAAQLTPALDDKVRALESGVKELHLKQDSIDQQLQRLERSLQALDKAVNSAPASVPVQPAPPPKVVLRTVVKSEPISWTIWLGFAGLIVAAAIGGFAYGRRGSFPRKPGETDEGLERMLAIAANAMRELESTPGPVAATELPAAQRRSASGLALDAQASQPSAGKDLELKNRSPSQLRSAGLSNKVLYEMDQALDNSRSMFTDEDRFIALGRIQNALSLLQFQIQKNPKDRGSRIKLMAIYRQERMDVELERATRDFRKHFPDE